MSPPEVPSSKETYRRCCGKPVKYQDRHWRVMLRYGRNRARIHVRRLYCEHCKRLHIELPDYLTPWKHYIENAMDDVSTPDNETTETYPVEKTMTRWKE